MKQVLFTIIVAIVAFTGFGGNAEAQTKNNKTCLIYRGAGGEAVFPGWPGEKSAKLEVEKAITVWLNDSCVEPTVTMEGAGEVKFLVEKEDLSEPTNVAVGWRVFFWTMDPTQVGKKVRATIRSGQEVWTVEITVHENLLVLARSAAKGAEEAQMTADEAQRKADSAHAKADNAKVVADEAKSVADEAHKNAGGTGGKRDFEFILSPMISMESPGREGYGMALGVNTILSKFGSRGMFQLGASGRLSWHYYELEVIGLAQNADIMASEFDTLAMGLLRLRPRNWVAFDLESGFGLRIFTHDDAVTLQNQELMIQGVEGRVAFHPVWAANLGVKFYLHQSLFLGVQYGTTVSLTRQVQNPNAEGGLPDKANVWNHFLMFSLGFSL
ncbi:hypothetical protein C0416_05565 [bacterium]|nr:hypothetical protein [bacterium]